MLATASILSTPLEAAWGAVLMQLLAIVLAKLERVKQQVNKMQLSGLLFWGKKTI